MEQKPEGPKTKSMSNRTKAANIALGVAAIATGVVGCEKTTSNIPKAPTPITTAVTPTPTPQSMEDMRRMIKEEVAEALAKKSTPAEIKTTPTPETQVQKNSRLANEAAKAQRAREELNSKIATEMANAQRAREEENSRRAREGTAVTDLFGNPAFYLLKDGETFDWDTTPKVQERCGSPTASIFIGPDQMGVILTRGDITLDPLNPADGKPQTTRYTAQPNTANPNTVNMAIFLGPAVGNRTRMVRDLTSKENLKQVYYAPSQNWESLIRKEARDIVLGSITNIDCQGARIFNVIVIDKNNFPLAKRTYLLPKEIR